MSYKKSKFGPNSAKPVPAALPGGLSNRTQTHHSESLMHHHISLHTKLSNLIIIHSLLSSPSQYSLLPALHSTCCFCACAFFDPVLIPTRLSLLRVAASATNLQILINQSINKIITLLYSTFHYLLDLVVLYFFYILFLLVLFFRMLFFLVFIRQNVRYMRFSFFVPPLVLLSEVLIVV